MLDLFFDVWRAVTEIAETKPFDRSKNARGKNQTKPNDAGIIGIFLNGSGKGLRKLQKQTHSAFRKKCLDYQTKPKLTRQMLYFFGARGLREVKIAETNPLGRCVVFHHRRPMSRAASHQKRENKPIHELNRGPISAASPRRQAKPTFRSLAASD